MNIGIIGFGYWGPNLVRNFKKIKSCNVTHISESQKNKHKIIRKLHPEIQIESFEKIVKNPQIDAIVIATSISSHYELAKKALENNKHVLIEKPLADSVKHSLALIKLSKKRKKILMVDHTYLYSGAIQKIKTILEKKSLGTILYVDSIRANLGKFQSDVNVLWDLAPHDISIINHLVVEKPISVQAFGKSFVKNKLENIGYLVLHYTSGKMVHINCSWASPIKIRTMIFGGTKKMLVFNDLEKNHIRLYDKNFSQNLNDVKIKSNDVFHEPKYSSKEPLHSMAEDFIKSILTNKIPISNYKIGLDVVKILEASQKSIKNKGKEISL